VSIGSTVTLLLKHWRLVPRLLRAATRAAFALRDYKRNRARPNLRNHIWDRFDDPPQCFYCDEPYSADTRNGECWGWSRNRPLREPRHAPSRAAQRS
jgi:UDP:flavonoid glycosyltransferase YjiC (YdhE family)